MALLGLLVALHPGQARADGNADRYQASYELEAKGQVAAALKTLKGLPASDQTGYFFKLREAWLTYLVGEFKASVDLYREAASQRPKAIEPLLGMLLPQIAARLWKDAEATARTILRMAPKNDTALGRLAWVLFNQGRYAEAARVYQQVMELFPANLEMQAGFAWCLLRQGQKAEAQRVFQGIVALSPKYQSAVDGLKASQ